MPKSLARNNRPPQLKSGEAERQLVASDVNALRAFEMFIDEHKSKRTIANELGVDRRTVQKYIQQEHERVLAGLGEKAAVVREQQNSQLDQIIERWMPLALHDELQVEGEKFNKKGEREIVTLDAWDAGTKAVDRVLKAIDQKAKINGLYTVEAKRSSDPNPADSIESFMHSLLPSLQRLVRPQVKTIEAVVLPS